MKKNIAKTVLLIAMGMLLLTLPACATGPVNHSFSFGYDGENSDVEILNWRYGDSKLAFTHAPEVYLATGHIPQGGNANGFFPVADSLYVKWRMKSTGHVYEDTVDLESRLPWMMNDKIVHFLIKGQHLYVYVIEGLNDFHSTGAPDCPVEFYKAYKCSELYPEHWSNF